MIWVAELWCWGAQPQPAGPTLLQALVASPHPQLGEDTAGRSEGCTAWVNALVGRIFWDFLREHYWAEQVASKIQKKLSKIKVRSRNDPGGTGGGSSKESPVLSRWWVPGCGDDPCVVSLHQLPYFMNELTLTELDMGTSIPSILSTSKPTINDRGMNPAALQSGRMPGLTAQQLLLRCQPGPQSREVLVGT